MHIYRADLRDLTACLTLDGSYETECVWQVVQQQEGEDVTARFRVVQLPRAVRVRYPNWSEALLAHQERGDMILVAAQAGDVWGYIDQEMQRDQDIAWVHHLVVAPAYRRQGLTRAVLLEGLRRLKARGMERACVSTQVNNTPARRLYESVGFQIVNQTLDYVQGE